LGGTARNQLHASGNNVRAGVLDQKMPIQNQLTLTWASVLPQLSLVAQGAFITALSAVVMRPWV